MNMQAQHIVDAAELERQDGLARRVFDINEGHFQKTGAQRLAFTHSYGCQQNVSDGEKLDGQLARMGYGFTDNADEADIIIFNTCAVREHAEDRVFGNIGALKHNKLRNPDMIIGVCGCMMQQEHVTEKIRAHYPFVDLVFGTYAVHKLPELVLACLTGTKHVVDVMEHEGYIAEGVPVRRSGSLKAWLPVMYGCNNFCSYCVVPYVRGRERSRASDVIIQEARELVSQGFREITLLGQNVNSYGNGVSDERSFAQLLREINAIDGDFRIRFMTSHPKDATGELFSAIADCEKVERHIHLPVQSASDRILKQMNRGYTAAQYLERIRLAKEIIDGVTFTSDIIVGFPGETYEDFKQTLALIEQVRYDALFTFIYSKRIGTRAAGMDDPVSHKQKTEWFSELLQVQAKIGRERYREQIGKTVRVLAETQGRSGEGYLSGRTEHSIMCEFKAPLEYLGRFVTVKVTNAQNWSLVGDVAD
ncbi:MAG: tRNA (N6-isopentenyl adenosine(37)-C2)-methylthiotransferase MiaB [Acetanaerobacterium sp.]